MAENTEKIEGFLSKTKKRNSYFLKIHTFQLPSGRIQKRLEQTNMKVFFRRNNKLTKLKQTRACVSDTLIVIGLCFLINLSPAISSE